MLIARASEATREQAILRIRLAGAALGATLLVLSPDGDRMLASIALAAYVVAATLLRYASPRFPRSQLTLAGAAVDVLFASALVSCLPATLPAWALYSIAIAASAYRWGTWGAVASTAGAVVTYDIVLAARAPVIAATDLWPVQVLIAVGLMCTELVLLLSHETRERALLTTYAMAHQDLVTAQGVDDVISRLIMHTVAALGASGAAVWRVDIAGRHDVVHARGEQVGPRADVEVDLGRSLRLVAALPAANERSRALIGDLAADARSLIATFSERDEHRRAIDLGRRVSDAITRVASESEQAAILAQLVIAATALGGRATVIRRRDGAFVAGEPASSELIVHVRDVTLPAIILDPDDGARRVAVVVAGPGLALAVSMPDSALDDAMLGALDRIAAVAAAMLERVTEREAITVQHREVASAAEELRAELRARDDAVASTVHELRTPLSSVSAYGQMIARQLQSALTQLAQIDRLIGDLRGETRAAPSLADVDIAQVVTEAARRQRMLTGADVDLDIDHDKPLVARADAGRIGQVLDNVLGNAVKYAPTDANVEVSVRRDGDSVIISVRDEGPGLAPADLERVFERYYRAGTSANVPGLGIGLAVSREIVAAHGGRIWAESAGPGEGSTFHIALPAVVPSERSPSATSAD